jgi:uncharacterized membrane protein
MMWGFGWGWVGAVFMVICIVMMVRMMSHGSHGSHADHGSPFTTHDRVDAPERTLANRLARGEIDVDEYERLREVLRGSANTLGT